MTTTTTSSPSAVIAVAEPGFTSAGHLVLAGYTGLTRAASATGNPDAPEPAWCTLVVIGRQVGEGTPKHRSVLRGAASHLPASLALRDTGSCPTAAPGDPAEILSRELMA